RRLDLPVFGRPVSPIVPQRCVTTTASFLQSLKHSLCGLLLGALARRSRPQHAQVELRNVALHLEGLLVRLALHRHDAVLRQPPVPRLQDFLQARLGVLRRPLRIEALDQRPESGEHRLARGVVAAVQEHRAEHRLDRIGEDRGPRLGAGGELALAQAQVLADAERLRHLGERLLADQARPQARELALRELRETRVEHVGDGTAEHAIAQELEALVVLGAAAAVRQRLLDKARIVEPVAQPFLERRGPRQSVYWPAEFAAKSMYSPTFETSGTSLR